MRRTVTIVRARHATRHAPSQETVRKRRHACLDRAPREARAARHTRLPRRSRAPLTPCDATRLERRSARRTRTRIPGAARDTRLRRRTTPQAETAAPISGAATLPRAARHAGRDTLERGVAHLRRGAQRPITVRRPVIHPARLPIDRAALVIDARIGTIHLLVLGLPPARRNRDDPRRPRDHPTSRAALARTRALHGRTDPAQADARPAARRARQPRVPIRIDRTHRLISTKTSKTPNRHIMIITAERIERITITDAAIHLRTPAPDIRLRRRHGPIPGRRPRTLIILIEHPITIKITTITRTIHTRLTSRAVTNPVVITRIRRDTLIASS